ncbi:MAG: branched-chain amino acid ABC transporter permease [Nitrososphaerota archaeon]
MKFSKSIKSLIILLLVLLIFYVVAPRFYTNYAFFETLVAFTILALSFNLIYGFTGYLPFGYAAFFGIGAYGFGIGVLRHFGVPFSIFLGGIFSVALGLVFIPMLKLRGAYFAIANLAAFEGVYYIISNQSLSSITRGPYGISVASVYNFNLTYEVSLIVLFVVIGVTYFVKSSNFGLALRAIRDDPLVASISGINVGLYRGVAWLLSALFGGLSGAVFGWFSGFFYPSSVFSINFSLFAILFTIFGGAGTLIGPILGTSFLYAVYEIVGVIYPLYFILIFGVLVVVLITILPEGLRDVFKKYLGWEML